MYMRTKAILFPAQSLSIVLTRWHRRSHKYHSWNKKVILSCEENHPFFGCLRAYCHAINKIYMQTRPQTRMAHTRLPKRLQPKHYVIASNFRRISFGGLLYVAWISYSFSSYYLKSRKCEAFGVQLVNGCVLLCAFVWRLPLKCHGNGRSVSNRAKEKRRVFPRYFFF